jgi:hypothetical protein
MDISIVIAIGVSVFVLSVLAAAWLTVSLKSGEKVTARAYLVAFLMILSLISLNVVLCLAPPSYYPDTLARFFGVIPTDTPTLTPSLTPTPSLTSAPTPPWTPRPTSTATPPFKPDLTPVATTPVYPLECRPIGGVVEPSVCVASVSVQVNEGTPRPVAYGERITLKAGDTLRLVSLRYCASHEALADAVAGEAYLFENGVESYENSLFTRGGPRIHADCGDVGDFQGSWIVELGQHRVFVILVHYFGTDYEVGDRFLFNLDVEP